VMDSSCVAKGYRSVVMDSHGVVKGSHCVVMGLNF